MQYKNNDNKSFMLAVLFGIILGFLCLLLLTLIMAFFLSALKLSGNISGILAIVILSISAFICGFSAAKKLKSKVLIIGVVAGTLFYLTVAVVSAAVTKNGFTGVFILRLVISFLTAEIGAFLSTVKKSKSKFI